MADNSKPFETFKFYHYDPSLAAAVVFIVLFVITTAYHTFQLARARTWYFIPFLVGGFFEFIGYIGRALSSKESPNWTLGPYIMQSLLLLLAPAFFAASIYMVLARIIVLTGGEEYSVIRVRWITRIFVAGDVFSFLMQSSGGGLQAKAKTQSDAKLGEKVIVGGLGVQILVFGFFIVVAAIFNSRIRANPTTLSKTATVPWQQHLHILYLGSGLIMVRSVFRIVEYVMGRDGVLLQHEYWLYIFDAALMFLVMALFNIWHPSKIISNRRGLDQRDPESQNGAYPLEESTMPMSSKR